MIRQAADLSRRAFVKMGATAIPVLAGSRGWSAQQQKRTRATENLFDGKTLNGWIQVENNATSLSASSILDPVAFTARLAHGQDPMSVFLRGQFDDRLKSDLSTYAASNANATALLSSIVKQINQVLGGPLIFTADRFRAITLRPETQALLQQNTRGWHLAHLNKMLLEDAFPAEIVSLSTSRIQRLVERDRLPCKCIMPASSMSTRTLASNSIPNRMS